MTRDPWYETRKAMREKREEAEKANFYKKMPKEDLIKIIESIKTELQTCEDAGDSLLTIADILDVDMRV